MAKSAKESKKTVGDFNQLGWYTLFVCLLYEFLIISQVSNLIYMVFGGSVANVVSCGEYSFANMTSSEACDAYEKIKSTGCTPKLEGDFQSVNYEFHFFCGNAGKVKMSTSVQMLGIMFGAMTFGQLSDSIGRRKTLIFGSVGLIISGFLSTFAPNIIIFTILRFFVMLFTGGKHSVSYVYMMESLPTKHRMWLVTVITYSPNYVVFTALAYFTGSWRLLSRVIAGLTFLPLIFLLFIQETPRWLVQKEKIDEAREALVTIAKWNGKNTAEHRKAIDDVLNQERERIRQAAGRPKKKYYTYHLFMYRDYAIYTILFSFSLVTTSIITYGLMFNFEKLSGSPFLNTIIIGSLRYTINLVVALIDIKFARVGRRLLHGCAMSFMAFGLGLVFIIMAFDLRMQSVIRMAALSVSAMGSQIYILNAIAPSELFPTAIRNVGMGFVQTFNRIGNVIAPQIFLLGSFWAPLPYFVMALMSLVEVIAYLALIPETKGKPLPDHMPDEGITDAEKQIEQEEDEVSEIPEKKPPFDDIRL
ncbi:unnamed protein product [Dracunculus medinensis]|uniref:MFS domain-containing protein n=1 Tax=Dracunculus medinensis TaxID=318479 RepID=A0A0N4U5T3_DRAME|nr:unnamed protein product [Dracunculus medinensis]